jgi:RimJ/RimL family protein N-acetyltransferase
MHHLETLRLILRPWRAEDHAPFAALNADPAVMKHFPAVLNTAESDSLAARIAGHFDEGGWGFWAVEVPGIAPFIGFIGLASVGDDLPFAPAVEIGWRLAHDQWGHGYATEGGRACVDFAFRELKLPSIVSFTTLANKRSRRVMERLGMSHDPAEDFDHPAAPGLRHVLYRLDRAAWDATQVHA